MSTTSLPGQTVGRSTGSRSVTVTKLTAPTSNGKPMTRRFVLASASPARRRLLESSGVRPDVLVSGVDESKISAPNTVELTKALASAKANAVAGRVHEALVLGCDSMLEFDGVGYGKPANARVARDRWAAMAGRSGVLHTGHCLLDVHEGYVRKRLTEVGSTAVHFGRPSEQELTAYLDSGEPMQVAGGFTLEGLGGWFMEGVDGDPGNVLGLSLPLLRQMLAQLDVSPAYLWSLA
jgi:septum formation protein